MTIERGTEPRKGKSRPLFGKKKPPRKKRKKENDVSDVLQIRGGI